jgi:hypothetical protein
MNTGYMIYQAERTPTRAEQLELDRVNSELAAGMTRRLHWVGAALASGVRSVRGAGRLEQVPGRTGEPQAVMQECL